MMATANPYPKTLRMTLPVGLGVYESATAVTTTGGLCFTIHGAGGMIRE